MFLAQVLRGIAIMFCLLPPTQLALGALTAAQVPDASGLFNLMRNLGGAIGIAVIDTILYGRTIGHGEALRDRLIAGDVSAATGDRARRAALPASAAGCDAGDDRGLRAADGRTRGVRDVGQRSLGAVVGGGARRAGVGVACREACGGAIEVAILICMEACPDCPRPVALAGTYS